MLDTALAYAGRGWPIFPCVARGKRPLTSHGLKDASMDPVVLHEWWKRWPAANIGLVTGIASGLVVLDVDPRHGGDASLAQLEQVHGTLPDTPEVLTGGGGRHLFFKHPGRIVRNDAGKKLGPGLDIRGDGGYVVAAGSFHPTGRVYEWVNEHHPKDIGLADLPVWLLARLTISGGKIQSIESPEHCELITEGQRNTTLASYAGIMRARGMEKEEIFAALRAINRGRCAPPLSEIEVRAIAESIGRYALPKPRSPVAGLKGGERIKLVADEIKHANHFAKSIDGTLYRYRNGCYRQGGDDFIRELTKDILLQNGNERWWNLRFAEEIVGYIKVDAPHMWQMPPRLVNIQNGLLNLDTNALIPHTPDHLWPIQYPVDFDPVATCPSWDRFVSETFPEDSQQLAWEIAAWLLDLNLALQKVILLYGPGGNGKSRALVGYCNLVGPENVVALSLQRLENDRFSPARLVGKVANVCPDLPSMAVESSSTFKSLVGGDPLTGERKFSTSFEFRYHGRLLFSANSYPRSKDASSAFFRRWRVVPFDREFPPGSRIPETTLDALLGSPGELSGLLNRALAALPALRARGDFFSSESTALAELEFIQATDPIEAFLSEVSVDDPNGLLSKKDVLIRYSAWASERGHPPITPKAFTQAIRRLRPRAKEIQRTVGEDVVRCWAGFAFKSCSHVSQDFSTSYDTRGERAREVSEEKKSHNPVNPVNPAITDPVPVPEEISLED
jgi:putative DNA primase/helicase